MILLGKKIAFAKAVDIMPSYTTLYYSNGTSASFLQSTITWSEVGKAGIYSSNTSVIQAIGGTNCTSIGSNAFCDCSNITSASFPACTSIGDEAFEYCYNLTTVSFPVCTTIKGWAFNYCKNLTIANFPACTSIGGGAFYGCRCLTSISFPVCTYIGDETFEDCSNLTSASFPACTSIGYGAFYSCYSLTTANFPACTYIVDAAFLFCYNLKSLYLTGSLVCYLEYLDAFTSTPIGGYSVSAGCYGSIYVPASLLTSYRNATNWTYFSSRFVGI